MATNGHVSACRSGLAHVCSVHRESPVSTGPVVERDTPTTPTCGRLADRTGPTALSSPQTTAHKPQLTVPLLPGRGPAHSPCAPRSLLRDSLLFSSVTHEGRSPLSSVPRQDGPGPPQSHVRDSPVSSSVTHQVRHQLTPRTPEGSEPAPPTPRRITSSRDASSVQPPWEPTESDTPRSSFQGCRPPYAELVDAALHGKMQTRGAQCRGVREGRREGERRPEVGRGGGKGTEGGEGRRRQEGGSHGKERGRGEGERREGARREGATNAGSMEQGAWGPRVCVSAVQTQVLHGTRLPMAGSLPSAVATLPFQDPGVGGGLLLRRLENHGTRGGAGVTGCGTHPSRPASGPLHARPRTPPQSLTRFTKDPTRIPPATNPPTPMP